MGLRHVLASVPFAVDANDRRTFALTSVARARVRFTLVLAFAALILAVNSLLGVRLPLLPLLLVLVFEGVVNQPYAFLLRLLRTVQRLYLLNITLDILGISVAGFVLGGLENRFLGLVFVVAIALIGATGGRLFAYWAATVSTAVYIAWAVLQQAGHAAPVPGIALRANDSDALLAVIVHAFSFYTLAYFVTIPARRLRGEVARWQRAEAEVQRLNGDLEERVLQRTAELKAANLELEAFSYSVSHDLRAPLRSLDGFSRILLAEYGADLPAEAQHYLQTIRQSAQTLGQLVDDLLALSRFARQPLAKRTVVVAPLVREALDSMSAEIDGRHLEIDIGALPNCLADPVLLRQVFANLLSNAIKFTRRCDRARIEVGSLASDSHSSDEVVYYVRDNGAGFDMQYADKLFGVFQRLHRAEEYEGTGVGLAIVERIVRRHGGRVWAEGELQRGATFYVALEEGYGDGTESG